MKKSFTHALMLSCLTVVAVGISPAWSAESDGVAEAERAINEATAAVGAMNASADYTGNPAMATTVAQPGQAMNPPGMQYGQPMYIVPGAPMPMTLPGQEKPEAPVTMRYNKKDAGGFYGAELPTRLFNNVPSDW